VTLTVRRSCIEAYAARTMRTTSRPSSPVTRQELVEVAVAARDAVAVGLRARTLGVDVEDADDLERLGEARGLEVGRRAATGADGRDAQRLHGARQARAGW
jgi:hypothetical protein